MHEMHHVHGFHGKHNTVNKATSSVYEELKAQSDLPQLQLQKTIEFLISESAEFRAEWTKLGDTALRVILYGDGITPGNVLAHQNKRKCWVWYISFMEFGPLLLSREEFWLPIAVHPVAVVRATPAGISGLTASILKVLDLGSPLVVMGRSYRMELYAILADEEGLNSMWHTKGALPSFFFGFTCGVDRPLLFQLRCFLPDLIAVLIAHHVLYMTCSGSHADSFEAVWVRMSACVGPQLQTMLGSFCSGCSRPFSEMQQLLRSARLTKCIA